MAINGKTYLEGRKDSRIVLKAHGNSGFTLPYVVNSKDMDKDFKSRDSAVNHFIIDAYISVFAIKKMHIHIPFDKTIAFFKEPALIGDHNYIRVENNGNAKANLVVKLVNPNKYAIQLDSFTYSLVIESKKYLEGEKYKKIALGPLDTQNINIPLVFKMGKFVKNLKGRDSAVFEFRFEFLLSTPDIKQEHITLLLNKSMPLIVDFDVAVEQVKINKLGFNNSDLTAYIKVGNPNNMDVNLDHLHYVLKVDGLQWVDGFYKKSIALRKKSSAYLALPIHLDTKKIGKSATDYLKGDKAQNYEIAAGFNLKTPDPMMKTVTMNVRNSGILHLAKLIGKVKKK
jgi:LEA14-like dessication related protein